MNGNRATTLEQYYTSQLVCFPVNVFLDLPESAAPLTSPVQVTHRSSTVGTLNVLIVEDDHAVRGVCASVADSLGCSVRMADSVAAARLLLTQLAVDLVFLDIRLPGESGEILLGEIRAAYPRALVVIMTAYATVSVAVSVMRNGAGHFLQKPFSLDHVVALIEEAAQRRSRFEASRALLDRLKAGVAAGQLLGASSAMQKVFRMVAKVAHTGHPLLILGEQSTGKESIARVIHANGQNNVSPFIAIDCESLEPARLEGCLFGTEHIPIEGTSPRRGLIASAGKGTVFFNEIGSLTSQAQVRLSRAIQERQIRPDGGKSPIPLEARIIASSSSPLEQMVEQGLFRKDLFYRLNVAKIFVPPLRERSEDVPLLAVHFLERQRSEKNTSFTFSDEVLALLSNHPWRGNVAELESTIEHACTYADEPMLRLEDMPTQFKQFVMATEAAVVEEKRQAAESADVPVIPLHQMEKQAIQHALRHFKGDKVLAAKFLDIGKTTLYRKLKEYGFPDDPD